MSSLMAILGGLDMLDTSISPLAGGTSHPPTETLVASLRNTPYDTGLDLASFLPITEHFRTVRRKYRQFESEFTGVDAEILTSQIPGGMLSNLAAQLTEQNALDRIKEVLDEVPRVRKEMGYPPLVTPTSQIVGTQATLNVLTGRAVQSHHHGNQELFPRTLRAGAGAARSRHHGPRDRGRPADQNPAGRSVGA